MTESGSLSLLSVLLTFLLSAFVQGAFRHPGLLHSREDLERMRKMVFEGMEPYKSGFEILKANPASQMGYRMRGPAEEIGRNPNMNSTQFDSDANAAYQLALMWAVLGEKAYADKAIGILNAWSTSLKHVTGRDAVLMAGLGPFKMLNAAEILRYTVPDWSQADIAQCERMFLDVIYPIVKDFAPFANGNWDAAAIQTVLAIGVFCEEHAIYERGLRYYVNGGGNGCLLHYVINEAGQCQESGRDQEHTQLGLALLAASCEVAWQQGLDLYAYADYRLLKGFEYTAKYNLGEEVPFVETLDRTGKYYHKQVSSKGRGQLRAIFEMVYNHYVNRANVAATYTQTAAEQIRPEGPGLPGADHPGFGTLLFSRFKEPLQVQNAPAAPGGLVAKGDPDKVALTWIASIGALSYTVKRAGALEGPYEVIACNVHSPAFMDKNVQAGCIYYYTVLAVNQKGGSTDAYPVGVCAGLPKDWQQADIGPVSISSLTRYDGQVFSVEASGVPLDFESDRLHFTYIPSSKDSILTARYVPQVTSQFTWFGLMMRRSLEPEAAFVSLQITPQFGGDVEAPGWHARLVKRQNTGAKGRADALKRLEDSYSSYGRLTGLCWLQLKRTGSIFTASISPDGKTWSVVGECSVDLGDNLLAGLAVSSGLPNLTTRVCFDHVGLKDCTSFASEHAGNQNDAQVETMTAISLFSPEIVKLLVQEVDYDF